MKDTLEFYDSLGLYLVTVLTEGILAIGLLYMFIAGYSPDDP